MKIRRIPITLALVATCLLMISCSKKKDDNSGTGNPAGTEVVPLKTGDWWKYKVETLLGDYSDYTYQVSVTGTKTVTLKGSPVTLYGLKISSPPDSLIQADTTLNYYKNQADGFYCYGKADSDTIKPALLYKYPVSEGETWIFSQDGITVNLKCISKNAWFSTPLGSFNCIKYYLKTSLDKALLSGMRPAEGLRPASRSGMDFFQYVYCTPGTGIIGEEMMMDTLMYARESLIQIHLEP
ncbi:MAG TPA: hypothetical protein PKG48_14005 [Bacteroidales bacterium]|nr:hypothetical protein [Bacteroidales bacterium]HPS63298.1 hypothetical protein [Bacteroidales bacterium]